MSEAAQDVAIADFVIAQRKAINWDEITDKNALWRLFWLCRGGGDVGARRKPGHFAHIKVRNRDRFRYDTDNALRLVTTQHPQGKKMSARKFWEFSAGANHDDNPYGQGLVHSLYWPVFFKRNDSKFWLISLEKFGMPTATGRIPGGKIDVPTECIKALQAIQADSAVVIPDDMTIELIEAARGGTADYTDLYERMHKAISKVVLTQVITTEDGSSRSQAECTQPQQQALQQQAFQQGYVPRQRGVQLAPQQQALGGHAEAPFADDIPF